MIGYSKAFHELYGPKPIEGKNKMNERIRELAKESGIMDYTKIFVPEMEKFAELIVRECAELVEYNSKGAGRDIREHFGVE